MTAGLWEHWLLPGIWITVQLTLYSAVFATLVAFGVGIAHLAAVDRPLPDRLLRGGLPRHLGSGVDVLVVLRDAAGL